MWSNGFHDIILLYPDPTGIQCDMASKRPGLHRYRCMSMSCERERERDECCLFCIAEEVTCNFLPECVKPGLDCACHTLPWSHDSDLTLDSVLWEELDNFTIPEREVLSARYVQLHVTWLVQLCWVNVMLIWEWQLVIFERMCTHTLLDDHCLIGAVSREPSRPCPLHAQAGG